MKWRLGARRRPADAEPPAPSGSATLPGSSVSGIAPGGFGSAVGRTVRAGLAQVVRRLPIVMAGLVAFLAAAWILVPTDLIAWRLGREARKRGYDVEIGDVSLRPWGEVVLEDVRWTFQPSRPGQVPDTLQVEQVSVDVGVWAWIFGSTQLEISTELGGGQVRVSWEDDGDDARVRARIEDVPLGALPKLHQMLNAPLGGTVFLDVDLTVPGKKFSATKGKVRLACKACTVGDGETLLFVPGSKGMLEKGVTVPEIDLGTLDGEIRFEKGVGETKEPIVADGKDVRLSLRGTIRLRDPFRKSTVDMVIKLQVSEAFQKEDERVRLLVQTMPESQRLKPPESGFGFRLMGSLLRPRLRGIHAKTREERRRERREAARRRAEKRAARKRRRAAAKKKKEKAREPSEAASAERDEDGGKLEIRPIDPKPSAPTIGKPVRLDPPKEGEEGEPATSERTADGSRDPSQSGEAGAIPEEAGDDGNEGRAEAAGGSAGPGTADSDGGGGSGGTDRPAEPSEEAEEVVVVQ